MHHRTTKDLHLASEKFSYQELTVSFIIISIINTNYLFIKLNRIILI